jgi:hypothetical protein
VFEAASLSGDRVVSERRKKLRLGLWYDFQNPDKWHQPADRLYRHRAFTKLTDRQRNAVIRIGLEGAELPVGGEGRGPAGWHKIAA